MKARSRGQVGETDLIVSAGGSAASGEVCRTRDARRAPLARRGALAGRLLSLSFLHLTLLCRALRGCAHSPALRLDSNIKAQQFALAPTLRVALVRPSASPRRTTSKQTKVFLPPLSARRPPSRSRRSDHSTAVKTSACLLLLLAQADLGSGASSPLHLGEPALFS